MHYLRGKLSYKTPITPELTKLVNPQKGGTNCRACAIAVDRLPADGAPSSAPANLGRGSDSAITGLYGGKPFLRTTLSGIVRDVLAGGDGARGIVWGFGPGKGDSHVFNVVNVKGDVIFLDGQSGHAKPGVHRNYGFLRTDQ
ncbi:toxin glutamine deamidase domain-containing protein [Streptomyces kanasensis]|uniref:toxin glutamine deamidase domain-containing protein n=1 Tax=Streptomyces kanasensis TaxID=936756 RepID=UPI0036FA1AF6